MKGYVSLEKPLEVILEDKVVAIAGCDLGKFLEVVKEEHGFKAVNIGPARVYKNPQDKHPKNVPAAVYLENKNVHEDDGIIIPSDDTIGFNSFTLFTYFSK